MRRALYLILCCILSLPGLARPVRPFGTNDYVTALKKVTDVMVNDVTSPVAASRYYAYVTMAAYEVGNCFDKQGYSLSTLLPAYKGIKKDSLLALNAEPSYAVIYAVFRMGEKLLPSGYLLGAQMDSLTVVAGKRGILRLRQQDSEKFVNDIVQQLLAYTRSDGFAALSGMPRYTPRTEDGYWQPTAPAFMQPVEPFWNTLRTFIIDSASQYRPAVPAGYDTTSGTEFRKQVDEVYRAVKFASAKERAIAMFWDCNPFALQQIGHVEFGLKKISPGGHWLGITGIACRTKKLNLEQTTFIHALVSITLADAFIACWDEKYRSDRIRPETVINRVIDPNWRPLLQTPPFPEYPSGHSVVSAAAAIVLSEMIGSNFTFVDDTEVEFGLPKRKFTSFRQASREAGISRMYGGIHYRDAVFQGLEQGERIGRLIVERLRQHLPPSVYSVSRR